MDNKSKRVLTRWSLYILLTLSFTIEDSSFIATVFGYTVYYIVSCIIADLLFKRKDDEPKGTS